MFIFIKGMVVKIRHSFKKKKEKKDIDMLPTQLK